MAYYLSTVRYNKTMENGAILKTSEQYLFDAMSYTEAETRSSEELAPYMSGEWEVAKITKQNFSEIVLSENENDDRFYKVKVSLITIDEKTMKEKRKAFTMLVKSSTVQNATKKADDVLESSMMDYCILAVSETQIMDYFKYEQKEPQNANNEE